MSIVVRKSEALSCSIIYCLVGMCCFVLLLSRFPYMALADDYVHDPKSPGAEAHCIVEYKGCVMDWTTGLIQAKGRSDDPKVAAFGNYGAVRKKNGELRTDGAMKLLRDKAQLSARKRMVHVFKSIAAGQERRVVKNGYSIHMLKAEMEKKTLNAELIASQQLPGGGVEVILETDIYGDFLQLILPPILQQIPEIEVIEPENRLDKNKIHTGMVVDAREIGFKPILYPVIVSEQGNQIYGGLFASREYAVEKGVCNYAYTPDPGVLARRVGDHPVMIKGLRKEGEANDTIVITISDADKIRKMAERHRFMKACKVLILVPKPLTVSTPLQ